MTTGRMAREALEGKREWREAVSAALSSSLECRALALRAASGGEDFKAAEEGVTVCGVFQFDDVNVSVFWSPRVSPSGVAHRHRGRVAAGDRRRHRPGGLRGQAHGVVRVRRGRRQLLQRQRARLVVRRVRVGVEDEARRVVVHRVSP